MSAGDHLNPQQFFHGTTYDVSDKVLPAKTAGTKVSGYSEGDPGDLSQGDHAFAIRNDEDYAWRAAIQFHNNGGRPRVYTVDPAPDMKPGPWNKEHRDFSYHVASRVNHSDPEALHQDEWASKEGFNVTGRVDIAPGHQGTFPQLNWNQFRGEGHGGYDANHPSDAVIKWGKFGNPPDDLDVARAAPRRGVDWSTDPPPHSELREAAGRPQKRWATLFD